MPTIYHQTRFEMVGTLRFAHPTNCAPKNGETSVRVRRERMMTLDEYHHAIRSREDFVAFVHALSRDLHTNREAWENNTLERFLEALGAWVEDMDGYYINQGKPAPQHPDWKILGDILMAATVYE